VSDVTEQELAAAFASKLGSVSPAIGQRLQTVDYRPRGRPRRKVAIRGFAVTPAVLIAVVATAAAASGGVVWVSNTTTKPAARRLTKPTPIFQKHRTFPFSQHGRLPANVVVRPETVIPASVRVRASASVRNYGKVQFWAGTTKQGGFCFAVLLPNGSWAGYPMSPHLTGGFYGGAAPACIDTEQQRSMGEGGQPSVEAPTTIEGFDDEVKSRTGHIWELFFGYVTTQGRAATVKDPASGHTTPVSPDGYYLLVEPPSSGDYSARLEVLDAAGTPLQPDYTRTGLLPGYKMGPTSGPRS
jgi:hypothetical protein